MDKTIPPARIDPKCLKIDADGVVRVSLSMPSKAWFDFHSRLGSFLQFVKSPVAVLGIGGPAPALECPHDLPLPVSSCGMMAPDLSQFGSLWAVRESNPDGPLFFLEVRDLAGRPSWRGLVPEESLARFWDLIEACQTPTSSHRPWFPPNHRHSTRRRHRLAARVPWLRRQWLEHSPDVTALDPSEIQSILRLAVRNRQQMRTVVYNHALVRSSIWTPQAMEHAPPKSPGADPGTSRYFGEETGLEWFTHDQATAWLWKGRCGCCAQQKWSVEIGGPHDKLALSLSAPNESQESAWREFLNGVLNASLP